MRGVVIIHGHFYQPPRENPWTGQVDVEPSAAPDHDWNARVTRESYLPLVSVAIDDNGKKSQVPVYEYLSFDFGSTLLDWMEREATEIYDAVLRADRASVQRLGHGNALAMPYHHIILPLASRRDKEAEVRWGIADFKKRFGRDPIGLWLPETAVDHETLDVIARAGIAFTVLAPHQVSKTPERGAPAKVELSYGRSIAVFVYNGVQAHDVADRPLLVRDCALHGLSITGDLEIRFFLRREAPRDVPALVPLVECDANVSVRAAHVRELHALDVRPRRLPIQGEGDRIEDRRLPRARPARDHRVLLRESKRRNRLLEVSHEPPHLDLLEDESLRTRGGLEVRDRGRLDLRVVPHERASFRTRRASTLIASRFGWSARTLST